MTCIGSRPNKPPRSYQKLEGEGGLEKLFVSDPTAGSIGNTMHEPETACVEQLIGNAVPGRAIKSVDGRLTISLVVWNPTLLPQSIRTSTVVVRHARAPQMTSNSLESSRLMPY